MNITINFTSFEIRGKAEDIENFFNKWNIHTTDIQYFSGYVVVSNMHLYQHIPEVKKAMAIRNKQSSIFDVLEEE